LPTSFGAKFPREFLQICSQTIFPFTRYGLAALSLSFREKMESRYRKIIFTAKRLRLKKETSAKLERLFEPILISGWIGPSKTGPLNLRQFFGLNFFSRLGVRCHFQSEKKVEKVLDEKSKKSFGANAVFSNFHGKLNQETDLPLLSQAVQIQNSMKRM
jgi:hypothetical protein